MKTRDIRRFRRALRQFERITTADLKRCCTLVTFAQCLVVLAVEDHGEPTMGELAAELRLDNSTLSRTIAGLVDKGYVERLQDPHDRRTVRVGLTASGEAACAAIHRDNDACCREVFEHIPADRRDDVIRHFELLVEALLAREAAACSCG